jgi:hypothetical protein
MASLPIRGYRQAWQDALNQVPDASRAQAIELRALLERRHTLRHEQVSIDRARRAMAIWHALHVPLSVALFGSALVHAVGALYFS